MVDEAMPVSVTGIDQQTGQIKKEQLLQLNRTWTFGMGV
jgi:hypothetical protein